MNLLSKSVQNRPIWYLDPAKLRRKQHYSWAHKDIKSVYALRNSGSSVKEIVDRIDPNLRKVQIYNILRITKKNLFNRCFQCGHELTDTEKAIDKSKWKRCPKCRKKHSDYKKHYRLKMLKRGLCGTGCGRPVIPGKTYCVTCNAWTQRQRYIKGLCGTCGKNPIDFQRSIALCTKCLDQNRHYSLKYRRARKKQQQVIA
jgi:predicted RNA-binding Zn-ribbon protein involved in translation (DUF1610 family)